MSREVADGIIITSVDPYQTATRAGSQIHVLTFQKSWQWFTSSFEHQYCAVKFGSRCWP